jgi:hypothetical protein
VKRKRGARSIASRNGEVDHAKAPNKHPITIERRAFYSFAKAARASRLPAQSSI